MPYHNIAFFKGFQDFIEKLTDNIIVEWITEQIFKENKISKKIKRWLPILFLLMGVIRMVGIFVANNGNNNINGYKNDSTPEFTLPRKGTSVITEDPTEEPTKKPGEEQQDVMNGGNCFTARRWRVNPERKLESLQCLNKRFSACGFRVVNGEIVVDVGPLPKERKCFLLANLDGLSTLDFSISLENVPDKRSFFIIGSVYEEPTKPPRGSLLILHLQTEKVSLTWTPDKSIIAWTQGEEIYPASNLSEIQGMMRVLEDRTEWLLNTPLSQNLQAPLPSLQQTRSLLLGYWIDKETKLRLRLTLQAEPSANK